MMSEPMADLQTPLQIWQVILSWKEMKNRTSVNEIPLIWIGHWWPVEAGTGTSIQATKHMPTLEAILVHWWP